MKVKSEKPIIKQQESKTLLEKEFEKANQIINLKTKELNTEKYEKTVENSKLKGEEKVLEVKTRHLGLELEDKEKENHGLICEQNSIEADIDELVKSVAFNLNVVKEKRKELASFKESMGTEYSNKKNDCANVNEESKGEILQTKMKLNQMIFSNQLKKEECDKLKKQLEQIEKQYQSALSYEVQGVKKATTIFKEMRDK
jgi:hypothetical protein